jgi:hypothetical protein
VGLVWWLLAPLPPVVKRADGLYRAGVEVNEASVAADGWFAVTALVAGIAVAVAVYLLTRPGRVVPLVALAVGGGLGAVVAWRTGALLGPGDLVSTAKGLAVGSHFSGPLDVSAYGVLLAWPMGAVIAYFAVAAGAETSDAGRETETESAYAGPPAGPSPGPAGEPPVSPAGGAAPSDPR